MVLNVMCYFFETRCIYAVACPSDRPSVCHAVDQSETAEVRILQFSPYGSPIPLVFAG